MITVKLPSFKSIDSYFEVLTWCDETFGLSKTDRLGRWIGGRWSLITPRTLAFTHSADAEFFSLRWL